ncbi:hypothetical protein LCGC14_2581020 [marine sediment metagenome]|uniref:Uncharacterized protein n=1 Tax=marine sediment metagenome TaxID=412755 RepID=A0A0F9CQI8_9ZZZZ
MKLSTLIKLWDVLHLHDTGDLGFCDLADVVEEVMGLENDISPLQPSGNP